MVLRKQNRDENDTKLPSLSNTFDLNGTGPLLVLAAPSSGFDETLRSRTVFISFRKAAICAAGTVDFMLADGLMAGAG